MTCYTLKAELPKSSPYLEPAAVALRYLISERTLDRWRSTGEGPAFVRIGPRRIVYRLADCEAWAAARTFSHRGAELAAQSAAGRTG